MKNIYGVELSKKDIENTIRIAEDLQRYGYNYNFFHKNYTQLLSKEDSRTLWNKALDRNTREC